MFSPSPCPRHYPWHWATMASADFCILTIPIAQGGAVCHHFLSAFFISFLTDKAGLSFSVPGCWIPGPTGYFTENNFILHGMQISPNKSMNFRYAGKRGTRLRTHHLPYFLFLGLNHVVLTDPETRPYMIFLLVAPYLCA